MTKLNWVQNKNYIQIVKPLLALPEVQQLANFTHHKHRTRLDHVLSVSYRAYVLAKLLHLNATAVARAGLLHDLYFIQGHYTMSGHTHAYWHPRIALQNAEKITTLTDIEKDIILKHMFGATKELPKYKESWLVNIVDDWQAVNDFCLPMRVKTCLQVIQSGGL